MSETQACLSQNDLRELKNDQLSQQQLEQFENHLTDCKPCRELLDATDVNPFPDWQSEIRPALRETYDLRLAETRAEDSAGNETFLRLLSPSEDPRMLGRIGNYEVVGIIGQGGMGVVFKAFETSLNRFVAIKMLLPHLTANGAARKRFLREAQAAAAVVDDHVLPIFGVDQWQETPYLVMKYCGGQTLQQRIGQQGPLELKEVLRIGTQAAKGLAAAHAQGLVHRDVKPSNILLDGSVDRAVLMDFGLARAVDDASITRTGIISGTPQYMSPEQVRADSVDARSDLFSLGSTLYAMCAGRPPFRAESAYSVMHRITHESPTPICEVNSDVPQWMGDVIDRLMSKTVEDRFESADEVAELLEGCLAHVQQPTTTKLPEAIASARSKRGGGSSWGKWLALACFAFFFALGGILLTFELNKGQLVIECAADNIPIRIMQGDVEVEKLTVSKEGATVKIAAGTYVVEVDGDSDNIVVEDNTVAISRGGVESLKIQLKPEADSVTEGWTPPENPTPNVVKEIIAGAEKDQLAGNHELCLVKYVWFHKHTQRYGRSNMGVSLYSVLGDWLELGEEYPPALVKMREVRDAVEVKLQKREGGRIDFGGFQNFESFNSKLRQPYRTVEFFKWLVKEHPKDAKRTYTTAKEALFKRREYEICGKYIDPVYDVKKICFNYEEELKRSSKNKYSFGDRVEERFVAEAATLIEILANTDRMDELKVAADSFKNYVEGKEVSVQLERAIDAAMQKKPPLENPEVLGKNDSDAAIQTQTPKENAVAADSIDQGWTPPENPDPRTILDEAVEDRLAEKYKLAFAKHLWYHENATRIRPSQTGVRLSSALSSWLQLGEKYPPALAKMRSVRDALEVKIRDENRVRVKFQDFHDFTAFNRTLQQEHRTAKLFKWLDEKGHEDASRVYDVSEDALILEEEYEVCGKYVHPIRDVKRICSFFNIGLTHASKFGKEYWVHVEEKIVKDSTRLIEILLFNGRQEEAKTVADKLKKFAKEHEVSDRLEKAIDAAMEKKPAM